MVCVCVSGIAVDNNVWSNLTQAV